MTGRLAGKVAIITGGASGMGQATVHRFLAEGARVVVADFNERTGAATVDEATAAGHSESVRFVRVDVSNEDDVAGMVELAEQEFGQLDVLFNNAGIGGAVGSITHVSLADWNETIAVLLTGVFLGIKHGARAMQAGGGGSIINTSSVAGLTGGMSAVAYTAAKHGVIGATRAAAVELAPHLIRVNAICPGGINTPLVNSGQPDRAGAHMDAMQPWPHHGRGDDIAAAAVFLASDESAFVTGEAMVVDGGLMSRPLAGADGRRALGDRVGISRGSTGLESELRPISDP